MKCRNCGIDVSAGNQCTSCGYKLDYSCPVCGKEAPEGTVFCSQCKWDFTTDILTYSSIILVDLALFNAKLENAISVWKNKSAPTTIPLESEIERQTRILRVALGKVRNEHNHWLYSLVFFALVYSPICLIEVIIVYMLYGMNLLESVN